MGAIFDSVPHFRGHTQEIIHMTRSQLGTAYRIAWTPTTPEQGTRCRFRRANYSLNRATL